MTWLTKILILLSKNTDNNSIKDYKANSKPLTLTTEYKPLFFTDEYESIDANNNAKLSHDNRYVTPLKSGTFDVIVVGVSFYQEALEKISGNKHEEGIELYTEANIVPYDDNPNDAHAVRVKICSKTVGHLSRKNAIIWRSKMISDNHSGLMKCPARIIWDRGYNKEGSYGVWLDLDLTLSDSKPESNIAQTASVSDNQSNHIEFLVDELNKFELSHCKVGDKVNLWEAGHSKEIFIYRQGVWFGEGKIGICPDSVYKVMMAAPGWGDVSIVSIYEGGCKINCRLLSKAEMQQRMMQMKADDEKKKASLKKRRIEKFSTEFQKKYSPKTSIKARFDIKKAYKLTKDDKIYLDIKSKKHYLRYPNQLRVDLLNQAQEKIGELRTQDVVLRIIKAFYNRYEFELNINSVYEHEYYPQADIEIVPKKKADG